MAEQPQTIVEPAAPTGKFIVIVPAVVFKKYPFPVTPVTGESPVTFGVVIQSTVPVLPNPV